ncbi:MAG: rod shape-determining protein MreD [Alphaproteobacteria bacterium]|jgi:rod shape-determining protein MreD|nr:rod shape-determining protein MreD [Alphaproteobacteria bacterium]
MLVISPLTLWAPYGAAGLLFLLEALPLPLPWAGVLRPPLFLAAVYYAAVYRPGLAPFAGLFVVGLLRDALIGLPLGAGTLPLLLARWAVGQWRLLFTSQTFLALWAGFALTALVITVLTWALASLAQGSLAPWAAGGVGAGLAVALFPLLTRFLRRALTLAPPV